MPSVKTIDPQSLKARLDAGDIVLIDVREPQEYAAERIHGALLFPLSTFDPKALPTGGKPVILQCGSAKRSGMAGERWIAAGATEDVVHLAGGIMAWKAAGLPTISVNPATGEVIDVR